VNLEVDDFKLKIYFNVLNQVDLKCWFHSFNSGGSFSTDLKQIMQQLITYFTHFENLWRNWCFDFNLLSSNDKLQISEEEED